MKWETIRRVVNWGIFLIMFLIVDEELLTGPFYWHGDQTNLAFNSSVNRNREFVLVLKLSSSIHPVNQPVLEQESKRSCRNSKLRSYSTGVNYRWPKTQNNSFEKNLFLKFVVDDGRETRVNNFQGATSIQRASLWEFCANHYKPLRQSRKSRKSNTRKSIENFNLSPFKMYTKVLDDALKFKVWNLSFLIGYICVSRCTFGSKKVRHFFVPALHFVQRIPGLYDHGKFELKVSILSGSLVKDLNTLDCLPNRHLSPLPMRLLSNLNPLIKRGIFHSCTDTFNVAKCPLSKITEGSGYCSFELGNIREELLSLTFDSKVLRSWSIWKE